MTQASSLCGGCAGEGGGAVRCQTCPAPCTGWKPVSLCFTSAPLSFTVRRFPSLLTKHVLLHSLAAAALVLAHAHAAAPVVSNIRASQRTGTKLVDIYYDATDADGDALTVKIQVSNDNGTTYAVPAFTFTGAVGSGVAPGTNRYAVWNAGFDWVITYLAYQV